MKNTSSIRTAIVALGCSLLFFTLTGLLGTLYVTHAAPVAGTPSSTTQASSTTSPTPTDTPSPTPTDTPSPTPTDTPSPTPTDTPSPTPTRTRPTPTPTQQPGPTATPTSSGSIPPPTATPVTNPTAVAATPTGSSNGGGVPNPTATAPLSSGGQTPTSPGSSTPFGNGGTKTAGGSNTFLFIFGGILTGIVLLAGAAIFLVRKFLVPAPATKANLPPSGAPPWSRTRGVSMDGNTNLYGWGNTADASQQTDINADPFRAQAALSYSGFPDPAAVSFADIADTPFQSAGTVGAQQVFQNIPSTDPGWMEAPVQQNEWGTPSTRPAPEPAFAQTYNGFAAAPDHQPEPQVNWAPDMGWGTGSEWGVWPTTIPEQATRPSVPAMPTIPATPHASGVTGSLRAVRASRLQAMPQSEPQEPDAR